MKRGVGCCFPLHEKPGERRLDIEYQLEGIHGVVRLLGTGTAQPGSSIEGAEYELAASAMVDKVDRALSLLA